jgi:glycosyltransferase involved in cell wall biosynthesis
MAKVSVIIPSCNELFLPQTVNDILTKATGEIEVIAVLDSYWPVPILPDHPNLTIIHLGRRSGMRAAINAGAAVAKGKYLMKCDAHCLFSQGFDEMLAADCADNWIVIPTRYSLDAENWCRREDKEPISAMHYFWPWAHPDDLGLHGRPWMQRARERKDILIDEDVTFQGSCWFCHAEHFRRIGGLSEVGYETFMGEPQEIGFKTQLGPWRGAIMRNRRTFYSHLHKGKVYGRMYSMSQSERVRGNAYSFDFWINNRWTERVMDFEDLIERFWPHPGWPDDWREVIEEYRNVRS